MLVPHIPFRHRLFTRLLISHTLLVTIPLLITGQILVNTAQQAIEETILEQNLEFARRSSRLIQATIRRAHDILRISAQTPIPYATQRTSQVLMINNLVSQFPIFKTVSILDTQGQVITSTSYGDQGQSFASDGELSRVLQKQSYTSEVYVSEEKLPLMDIAEPIVVFDEVSAILLGVVDLKEIWALVDSNVVGKNINAS